MLSVKPKSNVEKQNQKWELKVSSFPRHGLETESGGINHFPSITQITKRKETFCTGNGLRVVHHLLTQIPFPLISLCVFSPPISPPSFSLPRKKIRERRDRRRGEGRGARNVKADQKLAAAKLKPASKHESQRFVGNWREGLLGLFEEGGPRKKHAKEESKRLKYIWPDARIRYMRDEQREWCQQKETSITRNVNFSPSSQCTSISPSLFIPLSITHLNEQMMKLEERKKRKKIRGKKRKRKKGKKKKSKRPERPDVANIEKEQKESLPSRYPHPAFSLHFPSLPKMSPEKKKKKNKKEK